MFGKIADGLLERFQVELSDLLLSLPYYDFLEMQFGCVFVNSSLGDKVVEGNVSPATGVMVHDTEEKFLIQSLEAHH